MSKAKQYRELYNSAYKEEPTHANRLDNVDIQEDDIRISKEESGRPVGALLARSYDFVYSGTLLPLLFINGMVTRADRRGKGIGKGLLTETLAAAYQAGAAFAGLIPTMRHLYFYFDKFGFSTVFFNDEQRYTALHTFRDYSDSGYRPVEPTHSLLQRLEMETGCGIVHSAADIELIRRSVELAGGALAAVENGSGTAAFAAAVPNSPKPDSELTVKYLLAGDGHAEEAVLGQLQQLLGKRPMRVLAKPENTPRIRLRAAGMLRIVNVSAVLESLAAANPSLSRNIRVRDGLIERNNGVFRLHAGHCVQLSDTPEHLDLDVDVSVLAKILFSAPGTGKIFSLPTMRPLMAMM